MARLPYPAHDQLPPELDDLLNDLPRNNITEMLAHAQSLVEPFLRMAQANFSALALSHRQRELVILAVAGLVECDYEFVQHVPMFEAVGIDAVLRERIRSGEFDAPKDAGERALLSFVAALVRAPRVSDGVFAAARRHLSERQIVEVMQVAGFYWGLGRMCTVLELELDVPEALESITAVANMRS